MIKTVKDLQKDIAKYEYKIQLAQIEIENKTSDTRIGFNIE